MTLAERIQFTVDTLKKWEAEKRNGAEYYHADHEYRDEEKCLDRADTYHTIAAMLAGILEMERIAR